MKIPGVLALLLAWFPVGPVAAAGESGPLVIYSGRGEAFVDDLIHRFEREANQPVQVRYGQTAELAATILEEGRHSPADVFFAQDSGALGALSRAGRLQPLPDDVIDAVEPRFRSPRRQWVGVAGRARVVVYNTRQLTEADLPDDLFGFCDSRWNGRLGWAPANGSFQAFVTALRVREGEARARDWLRGIQANAPRVYPKNAPIVAAVAAGEIDAGFVNHYYLFRFLAEQGESFPARNYHPRAGDEGALVNVCGVGVLDTARRPEAATRFIRFLLGPDAQQYLADQTYEYPLAGGARLNPLLPPLEQIKTPDLDLGQLEDLDGTLKLLQDVGIL
jgi:iron(III) transport system substrate-binding protein